MLDNYELKIDRMINRYALNIFSNSNIIGVGRGRKIINGYMGNIPTLTFLVGKKLGYDFLNKRDLIPKFIGGITTDVIEVGQGSKIKSKGNISKNKINDEDKIAFGGGCLYIDEPETVSRCTLTYAVTDTKLKKSIYLLTSRHLLDQNNNFKQGQKIYYTKFLKSQEDISNIKDFGMLLALGAKVSKYEKILYSNRVNQSVDAALGYVGENNANTRKVIAPALLNGISITKIQEAKIGDVVYQIGSSTGYKEGKVLTLNTTTKIADENHTYDIYTNQINASMNGELESGDSGALGVIKNINKAFGMFNGGSDKANYYSSINNVFKDLEIELLT